MEPVLRYGAFNRALNEGKAAEAVKPDPMADAMRAVLDQPMWRKWGHVAVRCVCWFLLPFLALWGFGIEPVAAARVSAGISVAVTLAAALVQSLVLATTWAGLALRTPSPSS